MERWKIESLQLISKALAVHVFVRERCGEAIMTRRVSTLNATPLWPLFSHRTEAAAQRKLINIYIEASVASAANACSPFFAHFRHSAAGERKFFYFFDHLGMTLGDSSPQCQSQRAMALERKSKPGTYLRQAIAMLSDSCSLLCACDERSRRLAKDAQTQRDCFLFSASIHALSTGSSLFKLLTKQ